MAKAGGKAEKKSRAKAGEPKFGVHSEVGQLRKVMVCAPGLAHSRLTPPLPGLTSPNEVPQPSTTVNVTIGRIEVRAAPPLPRSSRRQAPESTLMSLDQYLQNRTSGDQR